MPVNFENQTVIVTGAGRGIGREYALGAASFGARVVVNDIGPGHREGLSSAAEVAAEIVANGGRAIAVEEDIATVAGGAAIAEAAMDYFGRIDGLINNAGILRRGLLEDMDPQEISDVLGVHLVGTFNVTQPVWKRMKAAGYGRIVCTGSSAMFGMEANACYAAAKAGMVGIVRSLGMEAEGHGIRVNGIIPLAISPMAMERPATAVPARDAQANVALQKQLAPRCPPASVAVATLYLASADCAVNGQMISAIGGRFARLSLEVGEGWTASGIEGLSRTTSPTRSRRSPTCPVPKRSRA